MIHNFRDLRFFCGSENLHCAHHGYDTVQSGRWLPTLHFYPEDGRRGSSETLVTTHQTAQCHNAKDHNLNSMFVRSEVFTAVKLKI